MTAAKAITIDLVALIRLTVDQVRGADERDILRRWLAHNGVAQQDVSVLLVDVVVPKPGKRV
jgi:hypothetical protein